MKICKRIVVFLLCIAMMLTLSGCAKKSATTLDPAHPTTVTVWHYYNGDQLSAFENLVNRFNDTIGAEQGIVVVSVSQGSIDNLASCLLDSVSGKVGADSVPSLAAVYPETVYILNQQEAVVPLDGYFTQEELAAYVPGFLEEGRLKEGGELLLLPVSKSTEAFVVNLTDFAPFTEATGITPESITTYEALTAAAAAYYAWTDSLTPDVPEDGKALYGRDSIANYIYTGTTSLGHEMFAVDKEGKVKVDLDRDTFRTLWDNFYVPFINGYFAANASHRSEDIKTGAVLAMTGSTSGISYIPSNVVTADDTGYDITVSVNAPLNFAAATNPVAAQQGADYCVLKTAEAEQYAAVQFLKWFTDIDQNLAFSLASGYSPVKLTANTADKVKANFTVDSPKTQNMLNALLVSVEVYTSGNTYTCKAFEGSRDVRDLLGSLLETACKTDRAAVAERIAAGATREEAVASYVTDEAFDAWFDDLCTQVNAIVK